MSWWPPLSFRPSMLASISPTAESAESDQIDLLQAGGGEPRTTVVVHPGSESPARGPGVAGEQGTWSSTRQHGAAWRSMRMGHGARLGVIAEPSDETEYLLVAKQIRIQSPYPHRHTLLHAGHTASRTRHVVSHGGQIGPTRVRASSAELARASPSPPHSSGRRSACRDVSLSR